MFSKTRNRKQRTVEILAVDNFTNDATQTHLKPTIQWRPIHRQTAGASDQRNSPQDNYADKNSI
jgi:hypothetical protein